MTVPTAKIRIGGTFVDKPILTRVNGVFVGRAAKRITAAVAPATYLGFTAAAQPPATWTPFAGTGVWNRADAMAATPHTNSAALITQLLADYTAPSAPKVGMSTPGQTSGLLDFGHPLYWARPTDPLFRLSLTSAYGGIVNNSEQIRIPDAAQPASGSDHHLVVCQPDGTLYEFWNVTAKPAGGGTLTAGIGNRLSIVGTGLNGASTAAHFSLIAGAIRAEELLGGQINHALFMVIQQGSALLDYGYSVVRDAGGSAYVYPAGAGDSTRAGSNRLAMGARLHLNMTDSQIAALSVPAWKKTILTALAHYGSYFGDTGGSGIGFQFLSGATYTSFGLVDPLLTFARTAPGDVSAVGGGVYQFDIATGVPWSTYLRVLPPPSP